MENIVKTAALTQQGIDLFFQTRYEESVALLDQALALNPTHGRAWSGKALCLLRLGNPKGALEMATRALEIEPHSAMAHTTLGLCRHRLGDERTAEQYYLKALELAPDDYRVYYNFACYWAERDQEAECRRCLEQTEALGPAHFQAVISADPDLARYGIAEWFRELLARMRQRQAADL